MSGNTYYAGRVHTIIFEDQSQAFYVVRLILDGSPNDEQVTVRGHVPGLPISNGSWFGFEGKWVEHPQHGRQILISRAPVLKNGWDPDAIEKSLVSSGVGERICLRIRTHFGDEDFATALADPQMLEQVPGITQFTAAHVTSRWESIQTYFRTLGFLNDLNLPKAKIRQVWTTFGDEAQKILSTNPWMLVQVEGISFAQADEVAMRLGLDMNSPERLRGAVLHVVQEGRGMGHLYMLSGDLSRTVQILVPGATNESIAGALVSLSKDKLLILDREVRPGTLAIYEPFAHMMESESARLLGIRQVEASYRNGKLSAANYIHGLASVGRGTKKAAASGDLLTTVTAAVDEWGEQSKITLTPLQREGVLNALIEPVSILTGLPGTGKTLSLSAVVRTLQDAGVPTLLVAPTGIASKKLGDVTGMKAFTIHRAFSARGIAEDGRDSTYTGVVGDAGKNTATADFGAEDDWGYDQENPYPCQVVIVDETSMVDSHLLYRLLTCTAPSCRMVFVGDAAQLPSVGPGNVLRDLINSGQFPVARLTEIKRQEGTSDIVFAAHAIHKGEMPALEEKSDFKLVERVGEEDVLQDILNLAQKLYGARKIFQILSPRHAGPVGVTNLNSHLRELLNPKTPGLAEIRLGKDTIREGDRVMVVKNNYPMGVYNGDVGKVDRIDMKGREVAVKIFNEPPLIVSFPFGEVPKYLRLAYAVTIHKSQGQEYDIIVLPCVDGFRHQLQRNLFYTGITRARKKVVLVGTQSALAKAIVNDKEDRRNTLLPDRIVRALLGQTSTVKE